jgi:hypothetical protein
MKKPLRSSPSIPKRENAMKIQTFVLASAALLALGTSSAMSGPCTMEIENLTKTLAAKDAGAGPTTGAAGAAQSTAQPSGQHPPSAIMGQEAQGRAMSPEEVRRQTAGQPTATGQATTGAAAPSGNTLEASRKLEVARSLDQQGKEADCMSAIGEAKQLAGPR